MSKTHVLFYPVCRVVCFGVGLLLAARTAHAQTTPAATPATRPQPGASSSQAGIGGPPVGQPQQQQLQQRRQQMQQAADQQQMPPRGGQPGAVGQPQPLPALGQPAGEAAVGSAPAPSGQGTLESVMHLRRVGQA